MEEQGNQQQAQVHVQERPVGRDWKKVLVPVALGVGCLPWAILGLIFLAWAVGTADVGARVGVIDISGVITAGGGEGGVFGGTSAGSQSIVQQLEEARRDKSVKVIVVRINSPGGSPAGSEEIYNEILRIRKGGKKVYVSMGDVAASGGYYIASAADKIYADASSITGSIGVIYESPEFTELFKKVGINFNTITTGKFKDIGNPARPLTPEDRALIKGIITDTYNKFVQDVSAGRKMPVEKVLSLADGRVFTGSQAKKLGLVDEIGGFRETTLAAARAAGIKGEPRVKGFRREGLVDILFGENSSGSSERLSGALRAQLLKFLLGSERSYQSLR